MAIFPGSAIPSADTGYTIDQSMYFGDAPSTSPRLSRQFDEAGSTSPKWTFATWYKKGPVTTSAKTLYYFRPLTVHTGADVEFTVQNDAEGGLRNNSWPGVYNPSISWDWDTDTKLALRDYSGWYHICHVIDHSTSPYVFIYINGVLQDISTIYGTKSGAGYGTNFSPVSGDTFFIGSNYSNQCGNGFFADTYWIEQQALTPADTFGEFDEDTGVFVPIEYTGTYSGNSFYLDYADSSNFGTDRSGLGNDFTVANIDARQQRLDTPTNNYCTLNPLDRGISSKASLSDGNLKNTSTGTAWTVAGLRGSFGVSSGKWYWEVLKTTTNDYSMYGVANADCSYSEDFGSPSNSWTAISETGKKFGDGAGGSGTTYMATWTNGDIIGIALNCDDGELTFYKNNATQGVAFTSLAGKELFPYLSLYDTSDAAIVNFGSDSSFYGNKTAQGNGGDGEDFYYTPPAGFKALNADNLPDVEIEKPGENFNTVLWTGNATARSITGVGFSPEMWWCKNRESSTENHRLQDVVRGATNQIYPNATSSQDTGVAQDLLSFDSDGFSIGTDNGCNETDDGIVAWLWKAGGAPTADNSAGAGATPTAGSVKIDGSNLGSALAGTIAATRLSANTSNGFSIVLYEGNDTSGATVAHGLSQAPELIILKSLSTYSWPVYSKPVGNTKYLLLDTNAAPVTDSGRWNDTTPSASVFSLGDDGIVNSSTVDFVAYSFHSVEGYSKVGSYDGNGNADGTFIYTGFRPAFFLIKDTDGTGNWLIYDDKRNGIKETLQRLFPDEPDGEATGASGIDFVSNGFKYRSTSTDMNGNGTTYVYLAMAESPFKYSNAR